MDRFRMFGKKEEKLSKEMSPTQRTNDQRSPFQFPSIAAGNTETIENSTKHKQNVPRYSLPHQNINESAKGLPDAKKSPYGEQPKKDMTHRPENSSNDLRKRVFKTKLSLDFKPLMRNNSKSNVLRKIEEENECMILEGGEVVRLRISSTSSTRSYRGEVTLNSNTGGSCSSASSSPASSPMDFSLPGTPESPTADIDNVFAQRMRVTMDSPDNMAEVIELARKLKFAPPRSEVGQSEIRQRLSEAQTVAESFPLCVVEENDSESDTSTNLHEELSDEEKKKNLQRSLDWLRMELIAMKKQDQDIAKQLMSIHLEIQRLRLQWSVQNHKTILENVAFDTEEESELISNLCEPPDHLKFLESSPRAYLRDMGLTKLNITNRRFSLR